MDNLLTVKDLNVELNHNKILEHVDFTINTGETLAVIGPNGAGKTILFKALLNLVPFTGQLTWAPNIKIGYVPQKLYIDPAIPLTVHDFFTLKNSPPVEIGRTLDAVNFKNPHRKLLHTKLGHLSGGQLQRVLIAWSLIHHPDILLFDEPTTGIDISSEDSIYNLLHNLQAKDKLALILISHDLQIVYRYATNVLCLNKEGLCFGPPKTALTENTLKHLFGESASIYHHQHQL